MDALYIGSRHDTTPLKITNKSWIYMDALPNFKAGFEEDHYSKKSYYLHCVFMHCKTDWQFDIFYERRARKHEHRIKSNCLF